MSAVIAGERRSGYRRLGGRSRCDKIAVDRGLNLWRSIVTDGPAEKSACDGPERNHRPTQDNSERLDSGSRSATVVTCENKGPSHRRFLNSAFVGVHPGAVDTSTALTGNSFLK